MVEGRGEGSVLTQALAVCEAAQTTAMCIFIHVFTEFYLKGRVTVSAEGRGGKDGEKNQSLIYGTGSVPFTDTPNTTTKCPHQARLAPCSLPFSST